MKFTAFLAATLATSLNAFSLRQVTPEADLDLSELVAQPELHSHSHAHSHSLLHSLADADADADQCGFFDYLTGNC